MDTSNPIQGAPALLAALPKLVGDMADGGDIVLLCLDGDSITARLRIEAGADAAGALRERTHRPEAVIIIERTPEPLGSGRLPGEDRAHARAAAIERQGIDIADALVLAPDAWGDRRHPDIARGPRAELDLYDPLPALAEIEAGAVGDDVHRAELAAMLEDAGPGTIDPIEAAVSLTADADAASQREALLAVADQPGRAAALMAMLDGPDAARALLAAHAEPCGPREALRDAGDRMLGFSGPAPTRLDERIHAWRRLADDAPADRAGGALIVLAHLHWWAGRPLQASALVAHAERAEPRLDGETPLPAVTRLLSQPVWMRRR